MITESLCVTRQRTGRSRAPLDKGEADTHTDGPICRTANSLTVINISLLVMPSIANTRPEYVVHQP